MTIELLQTHKLLKSCEDELAAKYTDHKLHDAADKDALLAEIRDRVRGIAGGNVQAELMDKLPRLEIIANFGVGYDTIDTKAAKARNIRVTNTPNVLTAAVAEITIGLMIALARRIPQAPQFVRDGNWIKGSFPLLSELNGKTVGIQGLGGFGLVFAVWVLVLLLCVVFVG